MTEQTEQTGQITSQLVLDLLPQYLHEYRERSNFLKSIHDQQVKGKLLSVKQKDVAVRIIMEILQANQTDRANRTDKIHVFPRLATLFRKVMESRDAASWELASKFTLLTEGLKLRNAMYSTPEHPLIYVTVMGNMRDMRDMRVGEKERETYYAGKIQDAVYKPSKEISKYGITEVLQLLNSVENDPRAAAITYGRKFGICSCCGRTLTNPVSIEAGIGPICAARWGF